MINLFITCHPLEFFLTYISVIVKIKYPSNDFYKLFLKINEENEVLNETDMMNDDGDLKMILKNYA